MNTGNKKGFTLIEILVVLVIFSIMLSAIAAVFISGIKIQRNAVGQEQLLDQLNYAVEYMGKNIRMAKMVYNNSCHSKNSFYYLNNGVLQFIDADGNCIKFQLNPTDSMIYKGPKDALGTALTSNDVKVTKLLFKIFGDAENSKIAQPRVTVLIEAESKSDSSQKARIETTISARNLNK